MGRSATTAYGSVHGYSRCCDALVCHCSRVCFFFNEGEEGENEERKEAGLSEQPSTAFLGVFVDRLTPISRPASALLMASLGQQ